MLDQNMHDLDDIDYEDMDDLPLLDHIEWNHYTDETEAIEDLSQMYWIDD
ncbi:MAG: hypothetical protein ACXWTH_05265 [Methylosarcina sp.]